MTTHIFDDGGFDELVQRFVDQELTATERVEFVVRLGRDEALRRRAVELESLMIDAGRLPRPIVPDGFAAGVMEKLPVRSTWRWLPDSLLTPRTLQWNMAGALAAAAILIVAAVVARDFMRPPPPEAPPVASAPAPASTTTPVRLVFMQPGARMVQVAGDFNGWNPSQTSLEQMSDGAWSVTIPLKPGRYAYMFVVDGRRWIADPFAAEQHDDGFGARNAVVEVRPELRGGPSL